MLFRRTIANAIVLCPLTCCRSEAGYKKKKKKKVSVEKEKKAKEAKSCLCIWS